MSAIVVAPENLENSPKEPQCKFFVVRKKRLCRMTVRPGRNYCGEHEPDPQTEEGKTDQRVPCPNDPKHTCYISKLQRHLAKCNARQGEIPPYIQHNINAPAAIEDCPRKPLSVISRETLMLVIEKVNKLFDQHVKNQITMFTPATTHDAVVDEITEEHRTESSRRHLRQVSGLMQLAEERGLRGEDTCYVELGAGKGMLAYYVGVSWCTTNSRVLLVERAARRHKRDNALREGSARRLRADLAHLALERAPVAAECGAVVGLAKHLCGVATDYALRCITADGVLRKARGAALATCCHHRCERPAYVANAHLEKLGITGEELNIMFSIGSWATCGDGRSRDRRADTAPPRAAPAPPPPPEYSIKHITDHGTYDLQAPKEPDSSGHLKYAFERAERRPLTQQCRERVGRRAKALIDWGRVLFLREKGFQADLYYYVPTTVSLENVCIVAKKDV